MAVPFAFANLSGNIALAKLDSNFNTPITIGNSSVLLGNTITTLNNLTLANVTITSGTSNVTNANVTSINVTNLTATLANITTLNVASSYVTASNVATAVIGNLTLSNVLTVPNGGTGANTSTGSGSVVLSNSPTLVTPALGTPTSGTLTNATGLPISTGVSGLGTGVATFLGTPTSANLATAVTDETGSGALVFATSPTLVTPALGTPASGNLANCTFPTLNQNTTGSAGSVANALTISSPLSGTSFNGSSATTIALSANYGDTQNPYASKTANYILAAPNGSAGVPTFRAIVAADIPTLNQNTTGTASNITGNLPVNNLNSGTGANGTTFWRGDGVWATPAGGGGSPGGSDTQIQFNNSGAFGGNANFTYASPTVTISSSTGSYNALIAQTTSTTRTDRPINLFKRTQTPAAGTVTSFIGEIHFNSKTQTGVAVDCAKISSSAVTSNAFTADLAPRIDFYTYNVTSGSSPAAFFSMQGRTSPVFSWGGYDGSTQATALQLDFNQLIPGLDNTTALGGPTERWSVVYSATGTINTSDRNEKQDIEEISDAERRAATRIKSLIRKFKFKDAVAKKGDSARIHFGVIAQDVQEAFLAEGLDASKYGLFCSDTFKTLNGKTVSKNEETGEYPEGSVESTKLGVRYEELLCFVIAST